MAGALVQLRRSHSGSRSEPGRRTRRIAIASPPIRRLLCALRQAAPGR